MEEVGVTAGVLPGKLVANHRANLVNAAVTLLAIEEDADGFVDVVLAMAQEPFAVDEIERVFLDFLFVTLEMLGEQRNVIRSSANALIAAAPTGALRTIEFDFCGLFFLGHGSFCTPDAGRSAMVRKATFVFILN